MAHENPQGTCPSRQRRTLDPRHSRATGEVQERGLADHHAAFQTLWELFKAVGAHSALMGSKHHSARSDFGRSPYAKQLLDIRGPLPYDPKHVLGIT